MPWYSIYMLLVLYNVIRLGGYLRCLFSLIHLLALPSPPLPKGIGGVRYFTLAIEHPRVLEHQLNVIIDLFIRRVNPLVKVGFDE